MVLVVNYTGTDSLMVQKTNYNGTNRPDNVYNSHHVPL